MVAKFDLFSAEERGFESKSVIDTRATTDKNDPFLNMGFKHGEKWVDKNGAKCNMGFGRITKNTRVRVLRSFVLDHSWTPFNQRPSDSRNCCRTREEPLKPCQEIIFSSTLFFLMETN